MRGKYVYTLLRVPQKAFVPWVFLIGFVGFKVYILMFLPQLF